MSLFYFINRKKGDKGALNLGISIFGFPLADFVGLILLFVFVMSCIYVRSVLRSFFD